MASADPPQDRRPRRLLLAAGLVLAALGIGASVLALTRGSGSSTTRTAARITVTSGDPVIRRNDAVTLSAYVEPADTTDAVLAVRSSDGKIQQHAMRGDSKGAFHHTIATSADLDYRIEVGPSASEWYAIIVVDPITLAAGSRVDVVPPAYA